MLCEREQTDKRIQQNNEKSEARSVDQILTLQCTGQNRVDVRAWILCNSILKDIGYSCGLFLMVFAHHFQSTKVHTTFICSLLYGAYFCAGKTPCNCKSPIECEFDEGDCRSMCIPGYFGKDCRFSCEVGWYGDNCEEPCECKIDKTCNNVDGNCSGSECEVGKTGWNCHTTLAELLAKNTSLPSSFGFPSTNNGKSLPRSVTTPSLIDTRQSYAKSLFTSVTTSVTSETKRSDEKSLLTSVTTSVTSETIRSSFSYNGSTFVSPVEMKPPVKIDLIVACTLAMMFVTCLTVTYYLHKRKIPNKVLKRGKSHISRRGLNRISEFDIQEEPQSDVKPQAAVDVADVMENDLQSASDSLSIETPPLLTSKTVNENGSNGKRSSKLLSNELNNDSKRNLKITNEKSAGMLNKITADVMQTGQKTKCRRCSKQEAITKTERD